MKSYIKTIYIVICCTISITAFAQKSKYVMPTKGICAHRGGMDTHPENTIPAFKDAISKGVQMMEFDIQFSKDSVLVIMHDDTVDRTTNGTGKIEDMTLAQIKQLDAGTKKGEQWAGTKVPTLEETLAIMPRNIWLNCHLKGDETLGYAVAKMIQKTGRLHQCMITGTELSAVGARKAAPGIIICNADNKYRNDNQQYVAATIAEKAGFIQLLSAADTVEKRQPYMDQLKKNRVQINYYKASTAEEAIPLWNAGFDFLLVNDVPLFLPELKKAGIAPVKPVY
jgi:glycerophosphoryl diester phosphodiesterase